jgi:hypothetical protein
MDARNDGEARNPIIGSLPVAGRPRWFLGLDSVHSTPRRFTPKIVAGRDVDPSPLKARPAQPTPDWAKGFTETGRQRAGRKRNPLRRPCHKISYAVTIAGQLYRNEPRHPDINHIALLREGAAAARLLAHELALLLDQEG